MDNHYAPGAIRWNVEQIKWILANSGSFKVGVYPPSHTETGYIGGKGKTRGAHASFEMPKQIWAELQVRIAHCNQDGYYMEAVYSSDNQLAEMDRIARAFNLDINEVSERVVRALKYCAGWCRRWQKCSTCKVKNCPKRGKKKAYEYTSYRY